MNAISTPMPNRAPTTPLHDRLQHLHGLLRRAWQAWRRQRDTARMHAALAGLDSHTLRDLGLDRSEIGSLAAEVSGQASADRLLSLHALGRLH